MYRRHMKNMYMQTKDRVRMICRTYLNRFSHSICNGPSPPLADIVLFGFSLKVFKTCLLGRGFHTLIKNVLFPSPTDEVSHNPSGPSVLAGTPSGV